MKTDFIEETFESNDLYRRSEICLKRKRYREASALLTEALKIAPDNPYYLSNLGLCVGMEGNFLAGERMCRKALTYSPFVLLFFVNLGKVLSEAGRRKEARKCLMRAYMLDNTNAMAAIELSRMGIRRGRVFRFLNRDHPLNIFFGKLRHRILGYKNSELKKL